MSTQGSTLAITEHTGVDSDMPSAASPEEQIAALQNERARLQAEYQVEVKRGDSATAQRLKARLRATLDAIEVLTDVGLAASHREAVSTQYEQFTHGVALGREYAADALDKMEQIDQRIEELAEDVQCAMDLVKRAGAAINKQLPINRMVEPQPELVLNVLNQRLMALRLIRGPGVSQDFQQARVAVGAMRGLDRLIQIAERLTPAAPDDVDPA